MKEYNIKKKEESKEESKEKPEKGTGKQFISRYLKLVFHRC